MECREIGVVVILLVGFLWAAFWYWLGWNDGGGE
jgi:hypothetical protein